MAAKSNLTLVEELLDLVNPAPHTFDPEHADLDGLTAARLSEYKEVESEQEEGVAPLRLQAGAALQELAEDPRYSGRAVSRRSLEADEEEEEETGVVEGLVDPLDALLGANHLRGDEPSEGEEKEEGEEEGESVSTAADEDNSDEIEGPCTSHRSAGEGMPLVFSAQQDDMGKGQAVALQISLWEGLMEGRIRLQKLLPLCNRLPQGDTMAALVEVSEPPILQEQQTCCSVLRTILDGLLEVQQTLLLSHKETRGVMLGRRCDQGEGAVTTGSSPHQTNTEEEIESDTVDEEEDPVNTEEAIPDNIPRNSRKRPPKPWCLPGGKRDYEGYVTHLQEQFSGYRDNTISKWDSKARLSSGKVSSKSFLNLDQSILGQVAQVLKDKDRLVKRTQLKRSSFKVLGKASNVQEGVASGNDNSTVPCPNAHLRDYDEEVFDDSDFYHQLLRELIEHKMDGTSISDSIAMSRPWLELQKLRGKMKRKVDTKASKGRKLRYQVHQKLVGFMAPLEMEGTADTTKDDLFSSLFGQRRGTSH